MPARRGAVATIGPNGTVIARCSGLLRQERQGKAVVENDKNEPGLTGSRERDRVLEDSITILLNER